MRSRPSRCASELELFFACERRAGACGIPARADGGAAATNARKQATAMYEAFTRADDAIRKLFPERSPGVKIPLRPRDFETPD
jgi:hypothetical protein